MWDKSPCSLTREKESPNPFVINLVIYIDFSWSLCLLDQHLSTNLYHSAHIMGVWAHPFLLRP